jgi:hypothetical protein
MVHNQGVCCSLYRIGPKVTEPSKGIWHSGEEIRGYSNDCERLDMELTANNNRIINAI